MTATAGMCFVAAGIAFALLQGCATAPDMAGARGRGYGGADMAAQAGDNGAYRLGAEDTIRIIVHNHDEWSGEYIIKPNGEIFLPNVGTIKAAGLTKNEFKALLTEDLERYIRDPVIEIDIVKYVSQVIYVLGEVGRPGEYPTEGKSVTLRDAVVAAGLPTRFAATGRVFVISPATGRPEQKVVNLHRVLYRGELEENIEIQPGEIVYVPKNVLGVISEFFSAILSPISSTASTARTTGTLP